MEVLALIFYLVIVIGIISIDRTLTKIRKLLESREKREAESRRVRELERL